MTNNVQQDNHSISGGWTELKQNLDPSFSYLIFEKNAGQEKPDDFKEIVSILSPFKKRIREHNIYQDGSGCRCLLVVQLRSRQKNQIISEIMNVKLPKDITLYIYGRRPK
jgi:hypothetical protein